MTDLLDEIKECFRRDTEDKDFGGFKVIEDDNPEAPAFGAMREYYEIQLYSAIRVGYRHFAGASLPTEQTRIVDLTWDVMQAPIIALIIRAFSDGLSIGQQDSPIVRMAFFYDKVDSLFDDDDHREQVKLFATGLANDDEVLDFFVTFVHQGLTHLAEATGFLQHQKAAAKVWDLWLLVGISSLSASYIAGHRLGRKWKERDVLDGIEIASEEGGDVDAPGEA